MHVEYDAGRRLAGTVKKNRCPVKKIQSFFAAHSYFHAEDTDTGTTDTAAAEQPSAVVRSTCTTSTNTQADILRSAGLEDSFTEENFFFIRNNWHLYYTCLFYVRYVVNASLV